MTYYDQEQRQYDRQFGNRDEGRGRDFGGRRDDARNEDRDYRGGMAHHSSRPYMQREDFDRYSDDSMRRWGGGRSTGERYGSPYGGPQYGGGYGQEYGAYGQLQGGGSYGPHQGAGQGQRRDEYGSDPYRGQSFSRGGDQYGQQREYGQQYASQGGSQHGPAESWNERNDERDGGGGSYRSSRSWGDRAMSGSGYGSGSFGGGTFGTRGYGGYSYGSGGYGGGGYSGGGYGGGNYSGLGNTGGGYGAGYGGSMGAGRAGNMDSEQPYGQSFGEGPYSGKGPKGYKRSDEKLIDEVSDRLERHGHIDASNLEIECSGGVVRLKGSVDSRRAKRIAEETAEQVYGVQDVMNELKVQRETNTDGSRMSVSRANDSSKEEKSEGAHATSSSSGKR